MDPLIIELLKQSPSTVGCVILTILFLKAIRERDNIFLASLQQFHKEVREDQGKNDDKTSSLIERNIDALAKNSERLDVNTDAVNDMRNYLHSK